MRSCDDVASRQSPSWKRSTETCARMRVKSRGASAPRRSSRLGHSASSSPPLRGARPGELPHFGTSGGRDGSATRLSVGRAWSPALTCVEDTAKRCDLASPRVGRVRSCREHRATNQLMTRAVTCKCLEKEEGRFSNGPRLLISGSTVRVRDGPPIVTRSEERRVGKEGRSRWSPYH